MQKTPKLCETKETDLPANENRSPRRFAVIGHGKIARVRFIPALMRCPEAVLTAIGTREVDKLDLAKMGYSPKVRVVNPDTIYKEGKNLADVVYIALPNDMHVDAILACAQAGLHVLCEKPLADNLEAALRCRAVGREHGVLIAEAFVWRHDPRHARVREWLNTGVIGTAHLFEATFSYFLEDLANIRLQRERKGGALMDVGCYGVDAARFLLEREPTQCLACAVRGEQSEVDEVTSCTLVFDSKIGEEASLSSPVSGPVLATITASTHLARQHNYRVRGTLGSIYVPNAFNVPDDEAQEIVFERAGENSFKETFAPIAVFEREISHFVSAVRDGEANRLGPAEDGVANAAVSESLIASIEEKRTIKVKTIPQEQACP